MTPKRIGKWVSAEGSASVSQYRRRLLAFGQFPSPITMHPLESDAGSAVNYTFKTSFLVLMMLDPGEPRYEDIWQSLHRCLLPQPYHDDSPSFPEQNQSPPYPANQFSRVPRHEIKQDACGLFWNSWCVDSSCHSGVRNSTDFP